MADDDSGNKEEESYVAAFIENLDVYSSRFKPPIATTSNNTDTTSQKSGDTYCYNPSFSLTDVETFLKTQATTSPLSASRQSLKNSKEEEEDDDDDMITEEIMNLEDFEKNLAKELKIVENTPTPERQR